MSFSRQNGKLCLKKALNWQHKNYRAACSYLDDTGGESSVTGQRQTLEWHHFFPLLAMFLD